MKKIILLALKLIVATAVIWALISYGVLDFAALRGAATHPIVLAIVVGILILMYLMSACRWYVLLKCQSVAVTVDAAIGVTFLTLFVGTFLPGGIVAGDAVRIAYIAKRLSSKRTAAGLSIFIDRLLGLYAMSLVVCAVALLDLTGIMQSVPLRLLATIAGTLSIGIPVLVYVLYVSLKQGTPLLHRIGNMLPGDFFTDVFHKLIEGLTLYRHAPGSVAIALGISVLTFALGIFCVMILGYSMRLGPLAPIDYGFAAPWASVASILPITPGGLGVGEAAFDRICHWREVNQTAAAYGTIFLVYRIATVVATLPGLAVYLLHRDTFKLFARLPDES